MTEKEIFHNMIRRVLTEKVADEESRNYYDEDDNSITIINANLEATTFYFDENGALDFFE